MTDHSRQATYRAGLKAKGMTSCKITVPLDKADALKAYAKQLRDGGDATTPMPEVEATDSNSSIEAFVVSRMDSVPAKYKKQAVNAVKAAAKEFTKEYESAVRKASADGAKRERARFIKMSKETEAEKKQLESARKRVPQLMSEKEFKKVRACLHPDKHNGDPRYGEAFEIFNRLVGPIEASEFKSSKKK